LPDADTAGKRNPTEELPAPSMSRGRAHVIPEVLQLYGIQAWTTRLPTTPVGEFDFYGGLRATVGPVQFDFGAMYYYWVTAPSS
jgi:hypothetical protein